MRTCLVKNMCYPYSWNLATVARYTGVGEVWAQNMVITSVTLVVPPMVLVPFTNCRLLDNVLVLAVCVSTKVTLSPAIKLVRLPEKILILPEQAPVCMGAVFALMVRLPDRLAPMLATRSMYVPRVTLFNCTLPIQF